MGRVGLEAVDQARCEAGDLESVAASLIDLERSPRFHRGRASWGLEAMKGLVAALGEIPRDVAVFHVAGSKGKGSVCWTLEALTRSCGLRTACYLSPHLERWEERYRMDGASDDARAMGSAIWRAVEAAKRLGGERPTWFELLTAGFLVRVLEQRPDVVILETGLGGRLDATNALRSDVAVITSIECEHEAILGSTLSEIAREKAGILKEGSLGVSGLARSETAASVLRDVAAARGVSLWERGVEFRTVRRAERLDVRLADETVRLPLPPTGPFAAHNTGLAVAALARLRESQHPRAAWDVPAWAGALESLVVPGRTERLGGRPTIYRDGAHTPRSLRAAASWIGQREGAAPVLVLGLQRDKKWKECLRALRGHIGPLLAVEVPGGRSLSPAALVAEAKSLGLEVVCEPSGTESLADLLRRARQIAGPNGSVLVAGSFWLIGDPSIQHASTAPDLGGTSCPTQ